MIGVPAWVGRYTRIPFNERGFDEGGCHCWGLVRLVLMQVGGLTVPKYSQASATVLLAAARVIGRDLYAPPWSLVQGEWSPLDVVVMQSRQTAGGVSHRYPGHVGIAVDNRRVLHVERGIDCVCIPKTDQSIRHRILYAVRHEALAA